MNCQCCNKDKKTRTEFANKFCPCCKGERKISFNRHAQFELGARVCWLFDGMDAPVFIMNERCRTIIHEIFREWGKTRMPELKDFEGKFYTEPIIVTYFFANQLTGTDCILYPI
jgi:hypothetical protein